MVATGVSTQVGSSDPSELDAGGTLASEELVPSPGFTAELDVASAELVGS